MKHYFKKKKLGLFIAALGFSAHIQAQDFRVSDIRIEGLQRVSASPVFAALPIAAGDMANQASIQEAVRSLFATGFFDDISVWHDGPILIFRVQERPTITEISIDGNKAIKTEALQEAMSANELAEGQIFKRATLDGILNELERQYVSQGRYAADVKADIEDLPNNQVKIDVLVDEGDVASIKHINIVGNKAFDEAELIGLFDLKTTDWTSWISSNDRYAREKLMGDIEKLESYYLDRGYLDFQVVSSQVSLSPDQKSVYITLNVNEGDIYTVKSIDLAGELIVPEENIRRLILLREDRTFSQNLMTSTSEYITTLMGNAGYTNAEVEGIPTPNKEDKTVDVTFFVNPGKRVYVRRIDFKGNTRTQDEVLRREMRQLEGASASNAKIEQGKVRLERLGFFKEVNVENVDVPGRDDQVDLLYSVEEQPSGAINASVGYGQGTGFILGASLQQNNWLGTGKAVGISVNHSPYQTVYNFSYSDPYFTPDGVNRGINLFYSAKDYSKINVTSYTTDSYGLNFSFGYPISEIQRLNFSLGLSHLSVKTGSYTVQEIRRTPFEIDLDVYQPYYIRASELVAGFADDTVFEDYSYQTGFVTEDMLVQTEEGFVDKNGSEFDTGNFKISWLRSTLNRGIMATRGSKQVLQMDVTAPGSDLQYYTIEFDGQMFQPISRDLTLRFRTSLGYGDGYGSMDRLPFFHNFYAGGFGSIRGFRRSSLGPQASPPATYSVNPTDFLAYDANGDGVNDAYLQTGNAYVLCDDAERFDVYGRQVCNVGELSKSISAPTTRNRSFGGNVLMEFGAELIFPIPFLKDQRSTQMALFLDAGNVFDTECGENQFNCNNVNLDQMRASVGLGLNWLSGMGPLTFSFAKAIKHEDTDQREGFQFSLGIPY